MKSFKCPKMPYTNGEWWKETNAAKNYTFYTLVRQLEKRRVIKFYVIQWIALKYVIHGEKTELKPSSEDDIKNITRVNDPFNIVILY